MADRRAILRYPSDVRSLGFSATWFALVAIQWMLPLSPWLILTWIPTAFLAFTGAVVTHNVIHTPMFTRPWMNDAWRVVQTLWYGQPVSLFVPVHNHSHHKYTQTRRDLTRSTKAKGEWQLANLFVASRWREAALRDSRAYLAEQRRQGKRLWFQFRTELTALLVTYAVLAVLDWKRFLLFVFLPHQVGIFCIKAINFLQHDGCDYDLTGYDHSRNFVGPVFNWFFLNNGFHTIHHMRPGLHWSVLPAKHAELVKPHIHPNLDVPSFWPWFFRAVVWPGRRERFDGGPFEWPPEGEGPDLPWDYALEALYDDAERGRASGSAEQRRAS